MDSTEVKGAYVFRGLATKCYLEKRVLVDIENCRVGRPRLSPKLEGKPSHLPL